MSISQKHKRVSQKRKWNWPPPPFSADYRAAVETNRLLRNGCADKLALEKNSEFVWDKTAAENSRKTLSATRKDPGPSFKAVAARKEAKADPSPLFKAVAARKEAKADPSPLFRAVAASKAAKALGAPLLAARRSSVRNPDSRWPLYFQVSDSGKIETGMFPDVLGPFSVMEVPKIFTEHLKLEGEGCAQAWKLLDVDKHDSDAHAQLHKLLCPLRRNSAHGTLEGKLAPVVDVTIPIEHWENYGIPQSTKMFCWSYPGVPWQGALPDYDPASEAVLAFIVYGGYVYFDEDGTVVKVTSVKYDPNGSLRFDRPVSCSTKWTNELVNADRFRPVTIREIAAEGAFYFAWVNPYEKLCGVEVGGEFGAFVYLDVLPRSEQDHKTRTTVDHEYCKGAHTIVAPEWIAVGNQYDSERGRHFHYVSNSISHSSQGGERTGIPTELLKDLSLVYDGKIVRGFQYNPETCQIIYDGQEEDEASCCQKLWRICGSRGTKQAAAADEESPRVQKAALRYARLYSMNSWYDDIVLTIIFVFLLLLDEYSHALFLWALLVTDNKLSDRRAKYGVAAVFILLYSIHMAFTLWKASTVWRTHFQPAENEGKKIGERGDVIISSYDKHYKPSQQKWSFFRNCYRLLQYNSRLLQHAGPYCRSEARGYRRLSGWNIEKLFFEVAILQYLGIRREVSDILMSVHPFQTHLQWAAFTKEQARLYMVSYPTKDMFDYDNVAGQEVDNLILLCKSLAFLLLKLQYSPQQMWGGFALLIMVGPTVFSTLKGVWKCVVIFRARHRLLRYLQEQHYKDPFNTINRDMFRMYHNMLPKSRLRTNSSATEL